VASLRDTAERLAAGPRGRTEADIQADVRDFLLGAPLDLDGDDLTTVSLEAKIGGGGRIDVEAGNTVFEVKKTLAPHSTAIEDARQQLGGYVRARTDELEQRYVGILTDGRTWLLHHLLVDGSFVEAGRFTITDAQASPRLAAWLETVMATVERIKPTPKEILRNLGADSPAFALDVSELQDLYRACSSVAEVQIKRELWGRLLVAALGTNFEDTDELFVTHTYLVLTAELIAHAVAGISLERTNDVRALLEGQQFQLAGLHGVVEADFFDWPALRPEGERVVNAIARRLTRFDWADVQHDILKALYESVIDVDTRHKLGEYYTPDWLAEHMIEETVSDPLRQRVLDPSCGSGTFLFWAVRQVLQAADEQGLSNREALKLVVERVSGIDLHPVVVTLARVTYLLAIGHDRISMRDELTIPVFLADSLRWEQDPNLFDEGGITIKTTEVPDAQSLHFPESLIEEPQRFDRLVAALAERAASPLRNDETTQRNQAAKSHASIRGLMNAHQIAQVDRPAVELVFEKMCRLHDAGRDHVWGYYIRNLARPLAFTRPGAQADILIGNPPWLAYRHMPPPIKQLYKELAKARGLWAGGSVATHQDLSDLFVARAVEQYLGPGGRFAFVMPFAVLSRQQYSGFRSGNFASQGAGAQAVSFGRAEEFARIKPPPFPVPSCVVSGARSATPVPLHPDPIRWTGRVPDHHMAWDDARGELRRDDTAAASHEISEVSPYRDHFIQGANLVPSVLMRVEREAMGPLGVPSGRVPLSSARSAFEKRPWKNLASLTGAVEAEFVRPMHTGATIVAFRAREPQEVVVPWHDGKLLDGASDKIDEYPGLAAWWREAEHLWNSHRSASTRLSLGGQIDFQGKLRKQFPIPVYRVAYAASGQHIAACVLNDQAAVIEHALYWAGMETRDEALYLCGILNSGALAAAVAPLQSRGQHNARHFDLHVFALPFPAFEPDSGLHRQIVQLALRAEGVAENVEFDPSWQFQKCRRHTREALLEAGVGVEIDAAVMELFATDQGAEPSSSEYVTSTPDLMGALSGTKRHAAGRTQRRARVKSRKTTAPGADGVKRDQDASGKKRRS
jgi:hypothetical protein